jgi:hypothetical protein
MNPTNIFILVCIFIAVYFVLQAGNKYWEPRIKEWAKQEQLTLINFRGAKFYEGPNKVLRSENQFAFHVKVRDKERKIKEAWLVFGKNWDPISRPDELAKVEWL